MTESQMSAIGRLGGVFFSEESGRASTFSSCLAKFHGERNDEGPVGVHVAGVDHLC
jgi:hypothetical protein